MSSALNPSESFTSSSRRASRNLTREKNSSRSLRSITSSFFGRTSSSKTLSDNVIDSPAPSSANAQSSSNLAAFLAANESKLLSYVKNQKGLYKGEMAWRATGANKWTHSVGTIHGNEGSLVITPADAIKDVNYSDESYAIVSNLRSVTVQINSELKQISLSTNDPAHEKYKQVYLRLHNEDDLLIWASVFLAWTYLKNTGLRNNLYSPSGSVRLHDRNWSGPLAEFKVRVLLPTTVSSYSSAFLASSDSSVSWIPSWLSINRDGLLVVSSDLSSRDSIIELNISRIIRHDIRKVNNSLVKNQRVISIDNLWKNSQSEKSRVNIPRSLLVMFTSQSEFEKCFVSLKALSQQQYYCPSVIHLGKSIRTSDTINVKVGHGKFNESKIRAIRNHIYKRVYTSSDTIDNSVLDLSIDVKLNDNIIARTTTSQSRIQKENNENNLSPITVEPFWYDEFSISELPLDFGTLKFVLRDTQNNIELGYAELVPQDHIFSVDKGINMNLLLSTSCSKDISLRFKSSISQDDSFIGEASIKLDYLGLKVLAPNHYEHLEAMIHDLSTNMCSRIANRFLSTPILLSDLGSSLNSLADSCTVISGDNPQNNSSLSDSKKGHASKSLFFSSLSTLQGISSLLLKINMSLGCAEAWLISLIDQEVNQISPLAKPDVNSSVTASPKLKTGIQSALNSLFRGNTLMSKCIDYYMQIVGLEFLQKYIQPITDEIINDRIILEIDPNRLDSSEATAEISENKKRLLKYVELTWSNIRLNIENLPLSIKRILSHLRHKLEETLSFEENTEDARGEIQSKNGVIFNCLSAFIFLRFLCPAILNPKLFGLSQVTPSSEVQRSLTLIAKVIQTFANRAHFGIKESYMMEMDELFISRQGQELDELFDQISGFSGNGDNSNPKENLMLAKSTSNLGLGIKPTSSLEKITIEPVVHDLPSVPFLMDKSSLLAQLVGLWNEMTQYPMQLKKSATANTISEEADLDMAMDDGMIDLFNIECQRIKKHSVKLITVLEEAEIPATISMEDWSNQLNKLTLDYNVQNGSVRYRLKNQIPAQSPVTSIGGDISGQVKANDNSSNRNSLRNRLSIGHSIHDGHSRRSSVIVNTNTDPGLASSSVRSASAASADRAGGAKVLQSFNPRMSLDRERRPSGLSSNTQARPQLASVNSRPQRLPRWMSMNFFRD